jgi:hypothetical protein
MLKITPDVLLFPRKLSGVVEQVALPIGIKKQITFSTKWIINY